MKAKKKRIRAVLVFLTIIASVLYFLLVINIKTGSTVESTLSRMYSTRINLSLSGMECFPNSVVASEDVNTINSTSLYKLIVFTDSTECTPCNISRIKDWNDVAQDVFSDYGDNAKLIFIFSPPQKRIQEIRKIVKESSEGWTIYLDTANVFQNANKQIPENRLFHTFLLNEDNEILCVGSPLYNDNMRHIYKKILKEGNSH